MCLCPKQYSLFSFYALPSGGKSKDLVVHLPMIIFVPTYTIGMTSGQTFLNVFKWVIPGLFSSFQYS